MPVTDRKLWSVEVITWVGEIFGTEPDGDIAYGLALSQSPDLVGRIQGYISENPLPKTHNEMITYLESLIGDNIEEKIERHRRFIEIIDALAALRSCVKAFEDPLSFNVQERRTPAQRKLAHRFDPVHWV